MFWHMGGIRTSLDTFWSQAGWFLTHNLQTVGAGNTTRAPIGPTTLISGTHTSSEKIYGGWMWLRVMWIDGEAGDSGPNFTQH